LLLAPVSCIRYLSTEVNQETVLRPSDNFSVTNAVEEIVQSLSLNVRHRCTWKFNRSELVPMRSSNIVSYERGSCSDISCFSVHLHPPKSDAVTKFLSLRTTLTKITESTAAVAAKFGYDDAWADAVNPAKSFHVPAANPVQNRSLCARALTKVSGGEPQALYDEEKLKLRASYVASIKSVFVAQEGYVATECGYFQQKESCSGTHDLHAEAWHSGCRNVMQELNISWSEIWTWVKAKETSGSISSDRIVSDEDVKIAADADQLQVLKACSSVRDLTVIPTAVDRVFTLTAVWDHNYHHFIADCLAKLVHSLDFLRRNEDIRIHIRGFEREKPGWVNDNGGEAYLRAVSRMRNRTLELLDLSPARFVVGPIVARQIYVPRSLACGYALWNPLELRMLSRVMLKGALQRVQREGSPEASAYRNIIQPSGMTTALSGMRPIGSTVGAYVAHGPGRPKRPRNVVILHRRSPKKDSDRDWTDFTLRSVVRSFTDFFPMHNVVVLSSEAMDDPAHCYACDLVVLSKTDVLVGAHGAGLTNQMFMPAGGLVIEIAGTFKDVNLPLCGYYGPFAAIFGHHHFLHAYDFQPFERRDRLPGGGRVADRAYHPLVGQLDQLARESSVFYKTFVRTP
jgi:hypothetical protein